MKHTWSTHVNIDYYQHKHKSYVHIVCTIKLLLQPGIAAWLQQNPMNSIHSNQPSEAKYQHKYTTQQNHKVMHL